MVTHREQIYRHRGWGAEGEGESYGERNMETYKTIYKTASQWEFAGSLRELKHGLCNNLEGWEGEGDGREAQGRGQTYTYMTDSC